MNKEKIVKHIDVCFDVIVHKLNDPTFNKDFKPQLTKLAKEVYAIAMKDIKKICDKEYEFFSNQKGAVEFDEGNKNAFEVMSSICSHEIEKIRGEGMKPYYQDDYATIYHGDSREIIKELPKFDLVLTDPPYGVNMDKGFSGFGGFGKPIERRKYKDNWDNNRPEKIVFDCILNCCETAIIWGGNFFADILPKSTHYIFWDKLQTMPTFGDGELAWTNMPRKSVTKVQIQYSGLLGKEPERWHPTQKPIKLMLWCIEHSKTDGVILDPFMGSGTTLRAAKDLQKKSVGIELEEKYCEIAAKRLSQEVLAF